MVELFQSPNRWQAWIYQRYPGSTSFEFFLRSIDPCSFPDEQNIGGIAACPFTPYLADHFGRRPTIFVGAVIMCIATIIQAASQSVGMFMGARCALIYLFPPIGSLTSLS